MTSEAPVEPELGVAFALVKGDRPELAVQKLTELGIDVIVPFVAERSVVRWDAERAARHHERLTRIAREAAMQCRRAWLPAVEVVTDFAGVAARSRAAITTVGGQKLDLTSHRLLLVGPEGGWSRGARASPAQGRAGELRAPFGDRGHRGRCSADRNARTFHLSNVWVI